MFNLLEVKNNDIKDIKLLYKQLKLRTYSISHNKLPSFEEHEIFVKKNPYRSWFFIKKGNDYIGSLYLTNDNVIGINLISENIQDYVEAIKIVLKVAKPLKGEKSIRSKYFLINANPKNENLLKAY